VEFDRLIGKIEGLLGNLMHTEGRASALGLRAAPILIIISRISVTVVVGGTETRQGF
jgi:hypothetical protein